MFMFFLKAISYCAKIHKNYNRHSGALMAAAISFFALLSLIPILSLTLAILGLTLGTSPVMLHKIQDGLMDYFPSSGMILYDALLNAHQHQGALGILGIGGLLYSASVIFANLESAFNSIWHVEIKRKWIRQRFVALYTALIAIFMVFCSIAITSAITWLESKRLQIMGLRSGNIPFLWQSAGHGVPILFSIALFTFLYRLVPNRPVPWKNALLGGLFSGVTWEIAKNLFAIYMVHFSSYNRIYGSLGGVIILMVWIYFSTFILLHGAEIVACSMHCSEE
jgi:membrane protein